MDEFQNQLEKTKLATTSALLAKLEAEKIELIREELKKRKITIPEDIRTVKEVKRYIRKNYPKLDYNKVENVINGIEKQLNSTIKKLRNGSTNAFTKLITSDLGKSILKTLGISLSARTALIIAPTLETKAAVATFMTGRGIYSIAKSNKRKKQINIENELNRILQDLELTRDEDGSLIDTRFSKSAQNFINEFLESKHLDYNKTGYLALREAIYSLDFDTKKELCIKLNNFINKGLDISARLEDAKNKNGLLDLAGNVTATTSRGLAWGAGIATMINSVDPALLAGPLNGTALGVWLQNKISSPAVSSLSGVLSGVGTEVLENIPVAGEFFENVFATENLIALSAAGASAALMGSLAIGVAQAGKSIVESKLSSAEYQRLIKADREKYQKDNEKELDNLINNEKNTQTQVENLAFDIVYNYLLDKGVKFKSTPKSMHQLELMIGDMKGKDAKVAKDCLMTVSNNIKSDRSKFVEGAKQFGRASICAALAGLSALSIYDIFKKGEFLPELSKQLFPENNLYILQENQSELPPISPRNESLSQDDETQTDWITDRTTAKSNYQTMDSSKTEQTFTSVYKNESGDRASVWDEGMETMKNNVNDAASIQAEHSSSNISEVKESWNNGKYFEAAWKFITGAFQNKSDSDKVITEAITGTASAGLDVAKNELDAVTSAAGVGVENIVTSETKIIPDATKMRELLRGSTDQNLTDLYRFVLGAKDVNHQSDNYEAIMSVLNENEFLNRATTYISKTNELIDAQNARQELATSIAEKIANYQVAVMAALDLGKDRQAKDISSIYENKVKVKR